MKYVVFLIFIWCLQSVSAFGGLRDSSDRFLLHRMEFQKYHRLITGKDAPDDLVEFSIDPKVSKSGKDAYRIHSSSSSSVAITGSNLRSVWYGLYDLLERRGGCRWFWDCDIVPEKDAMDLSGLDVYEEARFEYRALRYFAHRGLTRFQAEHWSLEDWKKEIDWILKRRLNVFMLRIGQDDLFQRAFPDIVSAPDAAKPLKGTGRGYDNRSLFWPLEYRGKLRRDLQHYAFDRGLMVPEDFGTMTHWYSRTPEDFLEKLKPSFLPQATQTYSEKNGLVWDVRDEKWVETYWKLTKTACDFYGQGDNQQLLHTIGLGERNCFKDRRENLKLKIYALKEFLKRAHRDYPKAKTLLAGWDFYFTWYPEEVRELIKELDPERDVIWDYEADATRDYRPEMKKFGGNNFTRWGVVGKFPYTYSIFLAYENALDIRANYPLIEERQKIVQNDPMCAGYVFWPESSHTDTLALRFFTANAWSDKPVPHEKVLDELCKSRYGNQAMMMKSAWEKVVPLSYMNDWGNNYSYLFTRNLFGERQYAPTAEDNAEKWRERLSNAVSAYLILSEIEWSGEAVKRDVVDLARTLLDRQIIIEADGVVKNFKKWRSGADNGESIVEAADRLAFLAERMADLLELHTDYSLWESYERLTRIERVPNPDFPSVLLDNAANSYCQSHQYESARYWYAPRAKKWAEKIKAVIRSGDRKARLALNDSRKVHSEFLKRPLKSMRPTCERTPEAFAALMRSILSVSKYD